MSVRAHLSSYDERSDTKSSRETIGTSIFGTLRSESISRRCRPGEGWSSASSLGLVGVQHLPPWSLFLFPAIFLVGSPRRIPQRGSAGSLSQSWCNCGGQRRSTWQKQHLQRGFGVRPSRPEAVSASTSASYYVDRTGVDMQDPFDNRSMFIRSLAQDNGGQHCVQQEVCASKRHLDLELQFAVACPGRTSVAMQDLGCS